MLNETNDAIEIARLRFASHLIEHGVGRRLAEAHAGSAEYEAVNDEVRIKYGAVRALSDEPATIAALAAQIAKNERANRSPRATDAAAAAPEGLTFEEFLRNPARGMDAAVEIAASAPSRSHGIVTAPTFEEMLRNPSKAIAAENGG
jgi:hypothetical protein